MHNFYSVIFFENVTLGAVQHCDGLVYKLTLGHKCFPKWFLKTLHQTISLKTNQIIVKYKSDKNVKRVIQSFKCALKSFTKQVNQLPSQASTQTQQWNNGDVKWEAQFK